MKTRSLSHLRNTAKGSIHHMEIHPVAGGKGFRLRTIRNPATQTPGAPLQPPVQDGETYRPTQPAMVAQLGKSLGIPQPDADNDGDSDTDSDSDGD